MEEVYFPLGTKKPELALRSLVPTRKALVKANEIMLRSLVSIESIQNVVVTEIVTFLLLFFKFKLRFSSHFRWRISNA